MIELQVEQGSPEWHAARLGIPTASEFHRIITPGGLKFSAQQTKYLAEKVAERILGFPMDSVTTAAMARGLAMEAQAVAWYEFQQDVTTRRSGICLLDNRSAGASVDRFVGENGILEVKCPLAPQHILYLMGADDDAYRLQCQGQMWITGRAWVDRLSFFDGLPAHVLRVNRDERVIGPLADEVSKFCVRLDAAERRIREMLEGAVAA